jgi:hypothetical protein
VVPLFRLSGVRGIHRQQGYLISLFFFFLQNERKWLKKPEHTFLSPAKLKPYSSSSQYSYSEVTSIWHSSKIFLTEGTCTDRNEQSEISLANGNQNIVTDAEVFCSLADEVCGKVRYLQEISLDHPTLMRYSRVMASQQQLVKTSNPKSVCM